MRQASADALAVEEVSQVMLSNGVIPESDFLAIHSKRNLGMGHVFCVADLMFNLVRKAHEIRRFDESQTSGKIGGNDV
jgi:hypothetical protein